jgi:periplasmic protein CpxP/Spy
MKKTFLHAAVVLMGAGLALGQQPAPQAPQTPQTPQAAGNQAPGQPPQPMMQQGPGRGGRGRGPMNGERMPMNAGRGPAVGMQGQGSRGMGIAPAGRWWTDPQLAQNLGLTDDQKQKMEDVFQKNRLTLIDLSAALQKQEAIMEPLLQGDKPDEAKVLAQIDKVASARAELEKANARMLFGIRSILTPEQWKKLQTERPGAAGAGGPQRPGGAGRGQQGPMGGPGSPQGPMGGPRR